MKLLRACLCFASIALLAGCSGPAGPETVRVTGNVTLDGAPVDAGAINFVPKDGVGPVVGGKIDNGKYAIDVPLGEKRVEISASKVVGQVPVYKGSPNSPMRDVTEETVPPNYNRNSTLTAKVEKNGEKKFDFPLVGKPAKK